MIAFVGFRGSKRTRRLQDRVRRRLGGIYYLSSRMGLMLGFFLLCRERSRRISTSEEG